MKTTRPKVGQIVSRIETDYYKEAMSELHWWTREKPKRLPRKLKKALKARSKPTEYRITSIVPSGGMHTTTVKPR